MITSHEYEGCGDNECPFCNGEPKCHHDDRQTGTLIDLCGLDRKQHHRRMRVVQLEVKEDGKVYKKEDQTMNNPTFVVRSQGQYVAGISDGHFTVTLTMNRTWVTKEVFEEIMTKVAQSLMALNEA